MYYIGYLLLEHSECSNNFIKKCHLILKLRPKNLSKQLFRIYSKHGMMLNILNEQIFNRKQTSLSNVEIQEIRDKV